jgi:hypothetical protein
MHEDELVIDFMEPDDPQMAGLVTVRDVSRYWKAEDQFVIRRLREHGVHFVKVLRPLMVRLSDVEDFEQAHTVYPEARGSNRNRAIKKEAAP